MTVPGHDGAVSAEPREKAPPAGLHEDAAASCPRGDVVVVVAARAATRVGDREFLHDTVAGVLGVPRDTVAIARECASCGGDHGRPVVARGGDGVHVSLSRAGGSVAVAVSFAGPVGVDIESLDAAAAAGFDAVAFGPDELAALSVATESAPRLRLALWTAKEAVLKATGDGLRVDPREVVVAVPAGTDHPVLLALPGAEVPPGDVHLAAFDAGAGLVGTVAVIAPARPGIRTAPPAPISPPAGAPDGDPRSRDRRGQSRGSGSA